MDLFEAAEARRRKTEAEANPAGAPAAEMEVLSISALTARIKGCLETQFPRVAVVGQVSNLTRAASGHVYLTLKDEGAEIGAVIWRSTAGRVAFELEDGQKVVVTGRVAVYERRGRYQVIISSIRPKGIGALQLAFLQLKERLEKEGLFDPAHKKRLPRFPETIGVVTSRTGAAVHDIVRMIKSRLPSVRVLLWPAPVQGDQAAPRIAAAIEELNRLGGIDVLIVGRGGGSLEDLWPFNEEVVARAIYASEIPVISAVGHEVDVSISDLVADARALTPTKAGEMVVPSRELLAERLAATERRLAQGLTGAVDRARAKLDALARSYGMRTPLERVRQRQQRLDEIERRMSLAGRRELDRVRDRLRRDADGLGALDPRNVLRRGYSITTRAGDVTPLRSPDEAPPGTPLRTVLQNGELESTADGLGAS
jgi:exodeoxyribonuclease VII large subunit